MQENSKGMSVTPGRLIVDLKRLDSGGEIFEGETAPDVVDIGESEFVQPCGGIRYKLKIQALGSELLVCGSLEQVFICRCAICDISFELKVKEPEFVDSFEITEENSFPDLTDAIREDIIVRLPAFPRCSENCRGLCKSCGADLNNSACGCGAVREDIRWSALDALGGVEQ
jgi:uncharacterized protein